MNSMSKYCNKAVTILVLLYVDKTICSGINKVRTRDPLKFWKKDRLSRRETFEIAKRGFGRGELRNAYVETDDDIGVNDLALVIVPLDDGNMRVAGLGKKVDGEQGDNSMEVHIRKIGVLIEKFLRQKKNVEKELENACVKYPNNNILDSIAKRYEFEVKVGKQVEKDENKHDEGMSKINVENEGFITKGQKKMGSDDVGTGIPLVETKKEKYTVR